jgi:hypothetical protein
MHTREGHNRLALSVSCRELIKRFRLYLWAPHITRAATRSCKSCNILRTEKVTCARLPMFNCASANRTYKARKPIPHLQYYTTTWNRVLGKLIVAETVIKLLATWNRNVHSRFHNSQSLYQLSQLNPVSRPLILFLLRLVFVFLSLIVAGIPQVACFLHELLLKFGMKF